MLPEDNSLEQGLESPATSSNTELINAVPQISTQSASPVQSVRNISFFHFNKTAFLVTAAAVLVIAVVGIGTVLLSSKGNKAPSSNKSAPADYSVSSVPLQGLRSSTQLDVGQTDHLSVNGQLEVNSTLVLSPTSAPNAPTAGQIYYNQQTNQPYYYNGSQFISMAPTSVPQHVSSLGGVSGNISVGNGLQITGSQLSVSPSVTQALSANGGSKFSSLSSSNSSLIVSSDGKGNYSLSDSSVVGTGTSGEIALFTGTGTIGGSILNQSGSSLSVNGSLSVSGSVTTSTVQSSGSGLALSAGTNDITFTDAGRNFVFPAGGGNSQIICTTGISCASGGGVAVLLQPGSVQQDNGSGSSIFVSNNGGGNLLELQKSGTDKFVIDNSGNISTTGSLSAAADISTTSQLQGASLSVASGNFTIDSSGNLITNGMATIQGAGGVSIGVAGTTNGSLVFANSSNSHLTTLQGLAPSGQNQTITIPASDVSTDTVCLLTLGNCAGAGGGVTESGGTQNFVPKFTNAGANQLGNSLIFDNGTTVGINNVTPGAGFKLDVTGNTNTSGIATVGTGLTVNSGGITVTGNSTISGTIASLTGITSSGSIIFSALNSTGVVHTNSSGQLSTGLVVLGTDTSGSYVSNLGTLVGLSVTGNSGAASTPNLSVSYGSTSGTAVQGNTTLICPSGTGNLSGGGNTITLGTSSSCNNLTITNSPTFSGTLAVQGSGGITIGTNTTAGVLSLADGTNSNLSLLKAGAPSGTGNATYTLPSLTGGSSDTVCLLALANCVGTGGGITGSGTTGDFAKFTGAGSVGNSTNISESGGAVTDSGTLVIQGSNALTLGTAGGSGHTGSIAFNNSTNTNTVTLQSGVPISSSITLTLPTTEGNNGDCLESDGSGNLNFNSCTGGAGGGVTSLDAQTGILSLSNSTGSGGVITISNAKADGATKGIATFSNTNFTATAGLINTVQDINSSAAPTFSGLTLSNQLTVANGGTGATSLTLNGILYGNGTSAIQATASANSSVLVTGNTGTPSLSQTLPSAVQTNITQTGALSTGSIASGFGSISTGNNITTTAALQGGTLSIAGGGFTVDASGNVVAAGTLAVQGSGGITIGTSSSAGSLNLADGTNSNLSVLKSGAPSGTGNATYTLPSIAGGNSDTVCLQVLANCVGTGGGISGSGSTGSIAKFSGAGSITSSNLSEAATTLTYAGNLLVNAANAFSGNLVNLEVNGSSELSVNQAGNITGGTLNGQTISSAASFTGTLAVTTLGSAGSTLLCYNSSSQFSNCASGAGSGSFILNSVSTQSANFNVQSATSGSVAGVLRANAAGTGDILDLQNGGGANVLTVGSTGNTLIKPSTNSTTAFQIQNTSGSSLLNVDSANSNITLDGNNSGELQAWQLATNASTGGIGFNLLEANGYLYAAGTEAGSQAFTAKLQSTGGTEAWNASASSIITPVHFASEVMVNGYAYIIGGQGAGPGFTKSAAVQYAKMNPNGTFGTWATTTSLPAARYTEASVVVNGYIYVIAGADGSVTKQATVYYAQANPDGTVGTWNTTTALPDVASSPAAVTANGYIYVLGGKDGSSNLTINNNIYSAKVNSDGTVGSWSTANNTGFPAVQGTASVILDGYIYAMGGLTPAGTDSNGVYYSKLNPDGTIGSWTQAAQSLPTALDTAGAAVVNGYIYVMGGNNSLTNLYYASGPRLQVGGSLDLVGLAGGNLNDSGGSSAQGSVGGSLTAGDTNIVGVLQVQGQANFTQSVNVNTTLSVGGSEAIQTQANTTTAFQVQNAAGTALLDADTQNMRLGVGVTYALMSAPSVVSAVASGSSGSLAAGTYYYAVSALDAYGGETTATQFAQVTVASTNVVTLTWTPVTGATGYRIYRTATNGASGSEAGYYITSGTSSGSNLTFTDGGTTQNNTTATPLSTGTAYVASNLINNEGQLSVGGNGTPSGQLYVSGTVPTSAIATVNTGSDPNNIVTVGHYAYIVNAVSNTLQIYDISDPTTPTLISTTSTGTSSPYRVVVQGRYAYIVNTGSPYDLQIYDVSNPSSPTLMSSTTTGNQPIGLTTKGHYAYVVNNSSSTLQVFDVTNPSSPSLVGAIATQNQPQSVIVQGHYAYVGDVSTAKLQIFDISNPSNIVLVSTISGPTGIVAVQDRIAYTTTAGGVQLYDVSNPASPVLLSSVSTTNGAAAGVLQGQYLYLTIPAQGITGFKIVDISNPVQPFLVGSVTSPSSSQPRGIAISGRYAYVIDSGLNTMGVYDLGGAYIQQLQAGGLEVTTAHIDNDLTVDGNTTLNNGLSVTGGLQVSGNSGIDGSLVIASSAINQPASVATATGTAANTILQVAGGLGGNTSIATTGTGGIGSGINLQTGAGGTASSALTSSTGGAGGLFTLNGGTGGAAAVAGTGQDIGGAGGGFSFVAGTGGAASGSTSGTNTGGSGGAVSLIAGNGGAATVGSGNLVGGTGGALTLQAGTGGSGATTGGTGGSATLQGGSAAGLNAAGGALTVSGGIGTGTGIGGTINFQVAKAGATSGSTLNSEATVFNLSGTNGAATFENSANSATAFQIQNAAGTPVLNVDTANSIASIQGINSNASLGTELMTSTTNFSSGWSGANWTFNGTSATHTAGSASAAVYSGFTPAASTTYQVTFTFNGASGNGIDAITPSIGGVASSAIYASSDTNETELITTTGTGSLQFTPTVSWAGTITSVSVKVLTAANSVLDVLNSSGAASLEIRASADAGNTFLGVNSGQSNTTGTYNTATGLNALQSNTTGSWNTATGTFVLQHNTTGADNTAAGNSALQYNTVGSANTANGNGALQFNTTGSSNTAIGHLALRSNTSGNSNVALGFQAGFTSNPGNANVAGSNNTFLGYNSGPGTATQLQNATAIGTYAVVSQNDSLVLGCISGTNGCTTSTSVGIGTSTPTATLDLRGSALFKNVANSITAFQIQNSAGTSNLLVADTINTRIGIGTAPTTAGYTLQVSGSILSTGSVSVANSFGTTAGNGSLQFQSATNSGGSIIHGAYFSSSANAGDVVIINGANGTSEQVSTTTTARDTRVYGLSETTVSAGITGDVVTSGDFTVNVDSGAVNIGDQLVTSTTTGLATVDNSATTGIIGYALSSKLAGSAGSVSIRVQSTSVTSTPDFRPTADSTTAFQIQNAAGSSTVLDANTTNMALGIAGASTTAGYALNVTGSVNVSTNFNVNGTAGSTVSCSSGNVLQNTVVTGGIITGGTCVANGGGSSNTLASVYSGGLSSANQTLALATANGGGVILQDATTTVGNLLTIQNNTGSTKYLNVTNTGISVGGTISATSNINSSGGTLQTNGSTRIDNSGNLTNIGNFTSTAGTTFTTTGANGFAFKPGTDNTTAFQVQSASGSTVLGIDTSGLNISLNGSTTVGGNTILQSNLTANGATLLHDNTNSITAFQIQNASNAVLLTADTTNMQVIVGSATNGLVMSATSGLVASGTAQHSKSLVLTAEYAGAVLDAANDSSCIAANSGTMTSGLNTGVTGFANKTVSFYNWTSSQTSSQCYDVAVEVPVPSDFASWNSAPAVQVWADNTSNTSAAVDVLDTAGSQDGGGAYASTLTPLSASTWQSESLNGLTGTYTPGQYFTMRIRMSANNSANLRVGSITLNYKSKF